MGACSTGAHDLLGFKDISEPMLAKLFQPIMNSIATRYQQERHLAHSMTAHSPLVGIKRGA